MFPVPDFPSLLSEFEEVFSASILERTIRVYDSELENCSLDHWSGNARDILCYIEEQLGAERIGLPHGAKAGEDLTHLRGERTDIQESYIENGRSPEITLSWELEEVREEPSEKDLPHAIAIMTAAVPANYADRSITLHEVKCLVRPMWSREAHGPFWRDEIQPLLLVSYMGQRHGRITQATFDGERLTIQYSQPFGFDNEAQASVEIFLRYMISLPVRPGGQILPFRAL
ncbi:hypothetical protein N7461_006296 [Penicillium sp. DV-2018c]|nr:hypothetical protein N7461_006296 [Penicillium sp. DV-2018c]